MTTNKVYPIILTNMKKKLSLYSKKFCCSVFNKDNLLIPLTAGLLVFSQFSVFSATFTTTTGGDWSVARIGEVLLPLLPLRQIQPLISIII